MIHRQAVGRTKDDVRPLHMFEWAVAIRDDGQQTLTIFGGRKDTDGIVTPRRTCGPCGHPVASGMEKISYAGYRFPPEIIDQAIWLYLRFTLSLRDVEDLLAERGVAVSYETVRRWVNHFGPMVAADLRKRRLKPHTTWHLDEVYLKIDGRMVYLWRAVDAEGEVLDVLVQSKRNRHAALKLMRKLLRKYALVPERLVTDDLRSYSAAVHVLGIQRRHVRGRWKNNRAENSHQPTRRRERMPIPTKPPVYNGMIAPRDSWMMPPPCNEMIPPGAPRLLA